ncbi:NAD(P)-binding protein [Myriangium duriaei CBS 260.36]|uniref:NAD(P)-binding protein n=1 Tax=Myriangium duriaei CBS 260.36 TaxID=1168546 RepID=A0A9P4IUJ0_9PEZI|nr:NAD(P)-binding protein [Myriangium duriaei CBS 260.36]
MKVLITGAGGFVGQLLAEQLLNDSHHVVLTDVFKPPVPPKAKNQSNAATLAADIYENASSVLNSDLETIFVFHGIMSAGSEADFDLGYRVNLHSTLRLLEAIRHTCPGVRVIYASSTAIYGQPLPEWPSEATLPTPSSSYGIQKVMIEHVINDYTRRGFINGFALRLPTISVRPGKPTAAASSWMSGMIREPLQGVESVVPCPDEFEAWLCSPRTLVRNLVHAAGLQKGVLPPHQRSVNLPGITANVKQMMEALKEVGGEEAVRLVKRERASDEIMAMLESWPVRFDVKKAKGLGFVADQDFKTAVEDFKQSLENK